MSKPTTHLRIVRDLSDQAAELVAPRKVLVMDIDVFAVLGNGDPWTGKVRLSLDTKKGVAELYSDGPTDEAGAGIWRDLFELLTGVKS